jgi:hypothetical protein
VFVEASVFPMILQLLQRRNGLPEHRFAAWIFIDKRYVNRFGAGTEQ